MRILSMVILFNAFAVSCYSQNSRWHLEIGENVSFTQNPLNSLTNNMSISYDVANHLYILAKVDGVIGLYKENEHRSFYDACNLGGGLGCHFWKLKNDCSMDFRVSIGQTIGNSTWKQTAYDAGLYVGGPKKAVAGIGFRHIKSHQCGVENHNGVFVMLGFRF